MQPHPQPQPQPVGYPQEQEQVVNAPQQQGCPQQALYPHQYADQPGQTIVIQSPPRSSASIYEKYPAKASMIFGGTQLTMGIMLVTLNIVAVYIDMYIDGHGIWCGVLFIITGSFGIVAGKNRTLCVIVAFMVLSIPSALLSLNVTVSSISEAYYDCMSYIYNKAHRFDYDNNGDHDDITEGNGGRVGVHATMLVVGFIECVVAIISSALCYVEVCRGRNYFAGTVISIGGNTQFITTQPGQSIQIQGGVVPMAYTPEGVRYRGAQDPPLMPSASAPGPDAPPAYEEKPRIYMI